MQKVCVPNLYVTCTVELILFDDIDQDMCRLLKQVYQVFEAACQGQEKADRDALIQFNPTVFEALFCI